MKRRFSYQKTETISIIYGIALISVGIALSIGVWIRSSAKSGILFTISWCTAFLFSLICLNLSRSDLIVTDDGISRELYGCRWKNIPWDTIAGIRVIKTPDYLSGRMINSYFIDVKNNRRSFFRNIGGTSFDDNLGGSSDLADIICNYAKININRR